MTFGWKADIATAAVFNWFTGLWDSGSEAHVPAGSYDRMTIARSHLGLAVVALAFSCSAAHASTRTDAVAAMKNGPADMTGTDSVLWTQDSAAASPSSCHNSLIYIQPARYGLYYVCGQWILHKPQGGRYHEIFFLALVVMAIGTRVTANKRS